MNFINSQINQNINKSGYFWRLAVIAVPFLSFLLIYGKILSFVILAPLLMVCAYFLFRNHIYALLILALPALSLGEIVNIPVTYNWIYEASLTEVLLIVAVSVFLIDKAINRQVGKIKVNGLLFLLFIYFLFSIISFFHIIDIRLYIFGLKLIVFSFLSYFLALNLIISRDKIKLFIYGLAATILILSGQLFIKFYQLGWSSKFFFERNLITIPLGPIATTAAILVLILPIVLGFYLYLNNKNKAKPFLFFIFLAGSLALFLTLGKAAIISLLLGLFYLFVKIKNKRVAFILTIAAFMVLSFVFFNSFFGGLFERLGNTFIDTNSQFRILEYQTGWKLINNNFWLGVGSGQQLYYFKKMLNFETSQLVNNFFLQAWIDLGFLGLTLVFFMFIKIIKQTIGLVKKISGSNLIIYYGFVAALLASLVNGLAEVTFFALPYGIIFWAIIGVLHNLDYSN
ncbi:MAG: O-antigen ligase family protein [Candidatus Falkowbacteria bacterium]